MKNENTRKKSKNSQSIGGNRILNRFVRTNLVNKVVKDKFEKMSLKKSKKNKRSKRNESVFTPTLETGSKLKIRKGAKTKLVKKWEDKYRNIRGFSIAFEKTFLAAELPLERIKPEAVVKNVLDQIKEDNISKEEIKAVDKWLKKNVEGGVNGWNDESVINYGFEAYKNTLEQKKIIYKDLVDNGYMDEEEYDRITAFSNSLSKEWFVNKLKYEKVKVHKYE